MNERRDVLDHLTENPGGQQSLEVSEKNPMVSATCQKTEYKSRIPTHQFPRSTMQAMSPGRFVTDDRSNDNSQINSGRRSTVNSPSRPASAKKPQSISVGTTQRRLLENQFSNKRKRYIALKKELADKQKTVQELYDDMSQLREKVIASGARDPGKIEEPRIAFHDSTPPTKRATLNEPQFHCGFGEQTQQKLPNTEKPVVTSEFVELLEDKLQQIPKRCQKLCEDMLDKHAAMVAKLISIDNGQITPVYTELGVQVDVYKQDVENLKNQLQETKTAQEQLIAELVKSAIELYTEYERYRERLKELEGAGESQRDLREKLDATMEELQTEREKSVQGKERLRQVEGQLQKGRVKIRELENHVANDETRIQQLVTNVKNLEAQIKQRDQTTEQRVKDMQRTMKNSEGLVAKMEKQRDSFESRLMELKEKMSSKEAEAVATINEMTERMRAVGTEAAEEKEKRLQAENALAEMKERYQELEEKSQQLCELAERSKEFAVTDGNHTENEVRLFNELQATRTENQELKENLMKVQQEKEEIVAVMHQAANHDEDSKDRLARELMVKSNELQNLTAKCLRLQKIAKMAQERNAAVERQLTEIQTRLHAQTKEGGNTAWSAHAIELQQQISDLRNNLAEVVKQNQELETALTQKQLELEQRDHVMREQSKFLKARDGLLSILKGRSQADDPEVSNAENDPDVDQVNREIAAKTEAIQELYATLENKQMQVMRLEKMVKLMEDQQDRAQAQRTRLENRIAQLELTLQEKSNKDHRSRGFGIL